MNGAMCLFPSRLREGLGEGVSVPATDTPSPNFSRKREGR
jgi:hypothetical protein